MPKQNTKTSGWTNLGLVIIAIILAIPYANITKNGIVMFFTQCKNLRCKDKIAEVESKDSAQTIKDGKLVDKYPTNPQAPVTQNLVASLPAAPRQPMLVGTKAPLSELPTTVALELLRPVIDPESDTMKAICNGKIDLTRAHEGQDSKNKSVYDKFILEASCTPTGSGINPFLVSAVINQKSNFDNSPSSTDNECVNKEGAVGLGGLTKGAVIKYKLLLIPTEENPNQRDLRCTPDLAIRATGKYLRILIDKYKSPELALANYDREENIILNRIMKRHKSDWSKISRDPELSKEILNDVNQIMKTFRIYLEITLREIYGAPQSPPIVTAALADSNQPKVVPALAVVPPRPIYELYKPIIDGETLQAVCDGKIDPTPYYEGQLEKESIYDAWLRESSCQSSVNPLLIAATYLQESGLNNSAREPDDTDGDGESNSDSDNIIDANHDGMVDECITSSTGAKGIAQFNKGTGTQEGLFPNGIDMRCDPHRSILVGGRYLAKLIKQYWSLEIALMGYNNCGESCQDKDVVKRNGSNWKLISNDPGLAEEPRIFVPAVIYNFRRYQSSLQNGIVNGTPVITAKSTETPETFAIPTMVVDLGPTGQSPMIAVHTFCKDGQAFIESKYRNTEFCSEGLCQSIVHDIPYEVQSIYIKGGANGQALLRCT
ncbi:transglycosylase SLT domain-containing protein [Candidatus Azambacteria bacterium]|nr:transglycosylase SLT domain-containing protein [Candidatus Azambacteria bacterium]